MESRDTEFRYGNGLCRTYETKLLRCLDLRRSWVAVCCVKPRWAFEYLGIFLGISSKCWAALGGRLG